MNYPTSPKPLSKSGYRTRRRFNAVLNRIASAVLSLRAVALSALFTPLVAQSRGIRLLPTYTRWRKRRTITARTPSPSIATDPSQSDVDDNDEYPPSCHVSDLDDDEYQEYLALIGPSPPTSPPAGYDLTPLPATSTPPAMPLRLPSILEEGEPPCFVRDPETPAMPSAHGLDPTATPFEPGPDIMRHLTQLILRETVAFLDTQEYEEYPYTPDDPTPASPLTTPLAFEEAFDPTNPPRLYAEDLELFLLEDFQSTLAWDIQELFMYPSTDYDYIMPVPDPIPE